MRDYPTGRITKLQDDEIFVFGSNESGIHGLGAAKDAFDHMDAKWGMGFGQHGNTFAIPTKDWDIKKLPLHVIEFYISRFLEYTRTKPNLIFFVTPIGCGLSKYKPTEIAPMFLGHPPNVILCPDFEKVLKHRKRETSRFIDWGHKYE